MGEAGEVRRVASGRLGDGWLRLLAEGEFAQALGIQFAQQPLIMAAGMAQRVAQQGEDQCGRVDLARAQFQIGDQQGVLQPLHQFGGEHRVARRAGFAARLQGLGQFADIHRGIQQCPLQQAVGALEQAEQQVLDENPAATACHAALGGIFQVVSGFGIQCLHQLL